MENLQNTVFISYRRSTSQFLARAIFMELHAHGYDVFLDVHTIDSGAFDRIILRQIAARTHFVILLSPGSLDRCVDEGDWLRREIEEALRLKRNVVPIIEEDFDFDREIQFLPEAWREEFSRHNALPLNNFYFEAGMEKLRTRFLKPPEYEVEIAPTPEADVQEVQQRIEKAVAVSKKEVSATKSASGGSSLNFKVVGAAVVLLVILAFIALQVLAPSEDDVELGASADNPVLQNADWTPVIENVNSVEVVKVPAGCFMMGSEDGENIQDDEKPAHEQCFDAPFWIDRYEVSNAQFAEFLNMQQGNNMSSEGYAYVAFTDPDTLLELVDGQWQPKSGYANYPAIEVSWYGARDYCASLGGQLPNEAQWEYAARGPDNLIYPWGNEFNSVALNFCDSNCSADWKEADFNDGYPHSAPIGTYEANVSWIGAVDMSGNVWEWIGSVYASGDDVMTYPYTTDNLVHTDFTYNDFSTTRGGSWWETMYRVTNANRGHFTTRRTTNTVGLRCVYTDLPSGEYTEIPVELAVDTSPDDGVTSNSQWTPVTQEINGVEMVLVPSGCFMMGSVWGDDNEQPVHQQCIDEPYWIGLYELTNAQYAEFLNTHGNNSPEDYVYLDAEDGDVRIEQVEGQWQAKDGYDNHPVIEVSWYGARDYCEALGGHLPNEVEWEYAARGPDNLVYPWGNEFDGEALNFCDVNCERDDNNPDFDDGFAKTAPVGSFENGVSWVGAYDMSGNVFEWTIVLYDSEIYFYPYVSDDGRENPERATDARTVHRGGSFYNDIFVMRGADRVHVDTSATNGRTGFRCVVPVNAQEEEETVDDTPVAVERVTSNAQWTPVIEEFDGVEMVMVPAGCFSMGSEDGNEDEQPIHEQCFDEPFWIDRYEVTNALYGSTGEWTHDNFPRDSVTWFEAQDFCEARDSRLPTEAEWEYAARGVDSLAFPWSNLFEGHRVTYTGNSNNQTALVGNRNDGISWVGASDMSGNISEWTSTIYDENNFPYPYTMNDGRENEDDTSSRRVLKGGAFLNNESDLRASNRFFSDPNFISNDQGFRCVREFE